MFSLTIRYGYVSTFIYTYLLAYLLTVRVTDSVGFNDGQ